MLADITRNGVQQAIDEFDRIGRDTFLEQYGFGRSRSYFLEHDGRFYDSKAICGAAHGYDHPNQGPLRPDDFSGGHATVARTLRKLGFTVTPSTDSRSEGTGEVELAAPATSPPVSDTARRFWWVNQNKTYAEEQAGGFLWSPKRRSDGARNKFYDNMRDVRPGDVVFSFRSTRISDIGVAQGTATIAPKPAFQSAAPEWSDEGWLVPVDFVPLNLDPPFREWVSSAVSTKSAS